jgi:hypothetical protein
MAFGGHLSICACAGQDFNDADLTGVLFSQPVFGARSATV